MAYRRVSKPRRRGGSWDIRWRVGRRRYCLSYPTRALADQHRKKIEHDLNAGLLGAGKPVTWDEFNERHYAPHWAMLNPRTATEYTRTLKYFQEAIRPGYVGDIQVHDIERFKARMVERGLAPMTVNKHLRHLQRVLGLATRWGLLPSNPVLLVDKLRVPKRMITIATEADLRAVLGVCPSPEWHRFFRLAWVFGLRTGDLRALAWERVDLDGHTLTHFDSKTQRDHIRPLPPAAMAVLDEWAERAGPLFPYLSSLSERHFYTLLAPIWASAGVTCRLHDFRRGLVSRLAAQGVHPSHIAAYTGQTPETTLRHYTRVDSLRPVADLLTLPADLPPAPA